jgi:hypothetical protein
VRVFDHRAIARGQLRKVRNVSDKRPDHLASTVTKRMRAAYRAESAIVAEAQLEALAKELERSHPGAAATREGLTETLTMLRVGVSSTLARALRSTNSIVIWSVCSCPGPHGDLSRRSAPPVMSRTPSGDLRIRSGAGSGLAWAGE